MSSIGPVYPAHFVVGHAEVKLVADQTDKAEAVTLRSDEQNIEAAEEIEAAQAKSASVNIVS